MSDRAISSVLVGHFNNFVKTFVENGIKAQLINHTLVPKKSN